MVRSKRSLRVLDGDSASAVSSKDGEAKVELRRARFDETTPQLKIPEHDSLTHSAGIIVDDEDGLDDGRTVEAPLGTKLLYQFFERQILVRIGAEGHLLHAFQRVPEGQRPAHVDTQGQHVQKEPTTDSNSLRGRLANGVPITDRPAGRRREGETPTQSAV